MIAFTVVVEESHSGASRQTTPLWTFVTLRTRSTTMNVQRSKCSLKSLFLLCILPMILMACGMPESHLGESPNTLEISSDEISPPSQALWTFTKEVVNAGYSLDAIPDTISSKAFNLNTGFGQTQQPLCADDDLNCQTEQVLTSKNVLSMMNVAFCMHSAQVGPTQFDSQWIRTSSGAWQGQATQAMIPVGNYATVCYLSSANSMGGKVEAVGMGQVIVKASTLSRPRLNLQALGWGQVGWNP